jgi:cytochrome c oxidase subunit 2
LFKKPQNIFVFSRIGAVVLLSALLLAGCGRKPVVLKVNLKKYRFEPPVLRVKRGQTVTLELQTSDVRHGFLVPDLNLQQAVPPGQPVTLTFKADRRGAFPMQCNIICGPGHDEMTGTIIVE